jgi:hypothetical protein
MSPWSLDEPLGFLAAARTDPLAVTMNVYTHVVQGHAARSCQPHGPAAQEAPGRERPRPLMSHMDVKGPAVIGWGPLHWWARTVSNRRHLLCKSSALPLSYAPVDEATAYMAHPPQLQTAVGPRSPQVGSPHAAGWRTGDSPTRETVGGRIDRGPGALLG